METKKRVLKLSVVAVFLGAAVLLLADYSQRQEATKASASTLTFEATTARLERGRYLVEGVAHCFMCHSEVDYQKPGAQPRPGKKGAGAIFVEDGFEWLVAPNITPDVETGAGAWSNEQLARAIREGIGHDGRRLFPMMPYMNFRSMSDEDLASVIVYLRSIEPVRNQLPKTVIPAVMKDMIPPQDSLTQSVSGPNMSSQVERGRYLVTMGNCGSCHTALNQQGQPMMDLVFAGGMRFKGPWGEVASANITPDPSGISYYDEELFVKTLRTGHVGARKLNSIMPWGYFRNLTDNDLKDMFAYLRTLTPVQHRVDNTEYATVCNICGGKHGFGELNNLISDSEHEE